MHIVSFLNVSNRDSLDTDSAYIMYNLLTPYFISNNNTFTFVSPQKLKCDVGDFIYHEFGNNKFSVRYSFDWDKVLEILKETKPDAIVVNQIEQIQNYRAVITAIGLNIKIVGYAHYIPFVVNENKPIEVDGTFYDIHIRKSIFFDYISGLESADIIFTHSQTSLNILKKLYLKYNIKFPTQKIVINPPPFDPYFIDKTVTRNKKKIVYNHRLYSHYGTEFFIFLCNEILRKYSIEIIVCDILGDRNEVRRKLDPKVDLYREQLKNTDGIKLIKCTDRQHYRSVLSESFLTIAPYRQNCIWSMSCIDSLCLGIPVLSPKIAWFKEFFDTKLQFNELNDAIEKIDVLLNEKSIWEEESIKSRKYLKGLHPKEVAEKFLLDIEKIL